MTDNSSPVTFMPAGPGREVAKLGDVEIGHVVTWPPDADCPRAFWLSYLPGDPRRPRQSLTVAAGKREVSDHVVEWLERADLTVIRSHSSAREARRHEGTRLDLARQRGPLARSGTPPIRIVKP